MDNRRVSRPTSSTRKKLTRLRSCFRWLCVLVNTNVSEQERTKTADDKHDIYISKVNKEFRMETMMAEFRRELSRNMQDFLTASLRAISSYNILKQIIFLRRKRVVASSRLFLLISASNAHLNVSLRDTACRLSRVHAFRSRRVSFFLRVSFDKFYRTTVYQSACSLWSDNMPVLVLSDAVYARFFHANFQSRPAPSRRSNQVTGANLRRRRNRVRQIGKGIQVRLIGSPEKGGDDKAS